MIRIFLADDHPMIQTALEALLGGTGKRIVGRAMSGAEALDLIPRVKADVIILDVQMPGGSGIHVLRELRRRDDRRRSHQQPTGRSGRVEYKAHASNRQAVGSGLGRLATIMQSKPDDGGRDSRKGQDNNLH